ncbi:MAG: hypothetical protein IH823_00710 [Candidatus Dadabacteria bacterium]|nr:hypothetical protein [Candidatus Dadabacteria bacterium]
MSFEKYSPPKKGRKAIAKPPKASVLKGGQISINSAAYKEYLKGAKYVELYFDASAMKIGLKPKKYPVKAGFAIRAVGKGKSNYRVNAKPLIEHHGVKVEKKIATTPKWNESEGLLEISL